jgi:hypothetical protein
MKKAKRAALGAVLVAACITAALVSGVVSHGGPAAAAAAGPCQLGSKIKHVIYLQFDNTHYRRDNASVPSDLEQMPHLLNFLKGNGTLLANHHTVLISHTAGGILSSLTGLYPDRHGQAVSNSYGYFSANGVPKFTTSFKYWTDLSNTDNALPNMVGPNGETAPAPWQTYTTAGCDVGGVSTANIVLENTSTAPTGDITKVFGSGSPEFNEAVANPSLAQTDFVGYAIHCSTASALCASGKPDDTTIVPGSNDGSKALFGAKNINPAITPDHNACVKTVDKTADVTDTAGRCGFPGFDGASAANTLGVVAQMQEAGVPVTFAYISDAHDNHRDPSRRNVAFGPGEKGYRDELASYDAAFQSFFTRLAADGIDKSNALFVVTADEGDVFAGGQGTPDPANPGSLTYTHANCTVLTACPSNQIGEINANLKALLPADSTRPVFDIHFDSAPTFYVNGQPGRYDTGVRKLEQDLSALSVPDALNGGAPTKVSEMMADTVAEKTLHMVTGDSNRTPTFTMFGDPRFFFTTTNQCKASAADPGFAECVDYHFAWSHGDVQDPIANTWLGLVGPGVRRGGINTTTWSDHTDIRPTINTLVGLSDNYEDDGRAITQILSGEGDRSSTKLGDAYKQVNAPFGQFAMEILKASTKALASTDPLKYDTIETTIGNLTAQRDTLAAQIRTALNAPRSEEGDNEGGGDQTKRWVKQAQDLIAQAQALAASS